MHRKSFYLAFQLLAIFCILLNSKGIFAHNVSVPDYSITHYSNENGLPQNSVKAIASDEYGFIWLATESGLCRFDGRRFYLFNKFNAGIVSSRIVDIWRSPVSGGLHAFTEKWIMLAIEKGDVRVEKRNWEHLYNRISPYSRTAAIMNHTWRYHGWTDPYHLDSTQLNLSNQQTVLLNKNGIVRWFRKGKREDSLHGPAIQHFNLYFTIDSFLYRLDARASVSEVALVTPDGYKNISLQGDIVKEKEPGERVLCVNQAARQVFIYSNKHFYLLSRQKDGSLTTRLLLEGFEFEKMRVSAGYYDTVNNRIFLGSYTKGLFVFSHKIFTTRTRGDSDADNVFYDLIAYSDTSVLTGKGVLLYSNSNDYRLLPKIAKSRSLIGNILYPAGDGTIWTADADYVYQYRHDATTLLNRWKINGVTAIAGIASGDIWLGTDRKGIYTIKQDHPEARPRLLFPNLDYVGCIQQESKDIVWIGTEDRLLKCNLATMRLDTIRQLDYKVVRGIYIPRENEVWLCTYEDGLYLHRNNRLTRFPADRSRALNTVHFIAGDKKGFLWITTNNGIIQVSRTDLLQYAADHTRSPFYMHYVKDNGFNTNEFNGGGRQVGTWLNNGYLAFPSMDGIVFFNPDKVNPELPNAPIIVDQIEVGGKEIPVSDTVVLESGFNNLQVRISTPYFGNSDNLMLEYRLDKGQWAALENETFAFNTIDAGRHLLTIRKKAGFNGSYTYKEILLNVKPAFYETTLFRMLCIVAVFLLIWLIIQLRLGFLNQRNRYLEQTVADRTYDLKEIIHALEVSEKKLSNELLFQEMLNKNIAHDIRTPLKYLVLFSKYLYGKVEKSEMPSIDEAEGIYVSSERIYSYTDKLTVYLKARMEKGHRRSPVNLYEIVEQNEAIFRLALRDKNSTIINDVPRGLAIVTHLQIFDILLHNLIDNAIKNTQSGTIRISVREEPGYLIVKVEDSGKGLTEYEAAIYNKYFSNNNDDSEQYTGFGFSIIKDILPILEVSIHVEAKPEGGACFNIRMNSDAAKTDL
jgi:signal transduction histidine kinase/ligand-binding sensor domain-containing protein